MTVLAVHMCSIRELTKALITPGVSVTVGNRSGSAACIDGAIF